MEVLTNTITRPARLLHNLLNEKYSIRRITIVFAILLLSVADAFFTLNILERGGTELNPIMAMAIENGTLFFLVSKYLLTSAGLLILCAFAYKRLAKSALISLLLFYITLFFLHINFYLKY